MAASTASRLSASSASGSDSVTELLLRLAGHFEVALGIDSLGGQPASGAMPHLVCLGVDELVGHFHIGLSDHGVHGGLAVLALDRALLGLGEPLLDLDRSYPSES